MKGSFGPQKGHDAQIESHRYEIYFHCRVGSGKIKLIFINIEICISAKVLFPPLQTNSLIVS